MLLCVVLLGGCAATGATADDAWAPLARAEGVYRGIAASGGMLVPVTTRFERTAAGALQGSYTFIQGGLAYEGTLSHGRADGPREATFIWHDDWGFGTLEVTFTEDFDAFTAVWGPLDDSDAAFPWVGERAP